MQRVETGSRAVARGVVLAVAVLAIAVVRSGPPAAETQGAEVYRDGDFIVYDAKANGTSAPSVRHDGYATYGNVSLRETYTIRLLESSGVERLRPHAEAVAATMRDTIGQQVVVAPGTVAAGVVSKTGFIDVRVSSTSPCTGQWLGCAAPTVRDGEVKSAQVWISPRLLERSTASIDNGVRHELGHAFGLAHYDAPWDGHLQTMHSTSFDASEYRSGDLNGLRSVAIHATPPPAAPEPEPDPTPEPAPAPVAVAAPPVDPTGSVDDIVSTGFGILVRGHASDPDTSDPIGVLITMDDQPFELLASRMDPDAGTANGFEVVWSVEPGMHRVCVVARNVGPGTDVPLGCSDVEVTRTSVGQLGLQTL